MVAPLTCPACGTVEGAYHARGCRLRPVAFRSCCRTPLWSDGTGNHLATCPEWGVVNAIRDDFLSFDDPWRDQ